jgi:two-component system LytT family sensor kinase
MQLLKAIALWAVLTFFFSLVNHSFEISDILIQGINSALFTIGFYFSYNVLVQPLLYKGRTKRFILLYILVIIILSATSMITVYEVYVFQDRKFFVDNYWSDPVFFTSNFMLVLLSTSTLLSSRLIRDKMHTQMLFENLEKEKISTELGFLKAQMNPHFLFNSLNNILFQIDKSNTVARETLLRFSEMLRYQLYECGTEQVDIEKEIQFIRNYIEIQSVRKTEKYQCTFDVSDKVRNFQMAPLILIPFIENSFKHISHHTSRKNSISISLDYSKGELIFNITNDKDDSSRISISENKGIGLVNVKRRLDLLYDSRYDLKIYDTESEFSVSLKIKINPADQ